VDEEMQFYLPRQKKLGGSMVEENLVYLKL
jgi:hypothetical protein